VEQKDERDFSATKCDRGVYANVTTVFLGPTAKKKSLRYSHDASRSAGNVRAMRVRPEEVLRRHDPDKLTVRRDYWKARDTLLQH
jgi:hypothetical protein